jgi:hypothetical protein
LFIKHHRGIEVLIVVLLADLVEAVLGVCVAAGCLGLALLREDQDLPLRLAAEALSLVLQAVVAVPQRVVPNVGV